MLSKTVLSKAALLDHLKKKDGKEVVKIIATIVYEGKVDWLNATIEKSLETPFTCVNGSINTTYKLKDNES